MHIRTFRAASLHAALEDIRTQMGPEASVLHTRQVREGLWGWLGRAQVEVTAGLREANDPLPNAIPRRPPLIRPNFEQLAISSTTLLANSPTMFPSDSTMLAPSPLQALYTELLRVGVSPSDAQRWIEATRSFSASLGESGVVRSAAEELHRTVAREIQLAGPIRTQPGARHVVALVGPTGVGKTTTIAKLAAGFRIEARRKVGLLTIDTFRIAAVQQLRAYAEIMDLPMEVVEHCDDMRSALDRLGDVDLVLIDTAGRSPRSDARIEQLVTFLRAAQPDETHLVLSATAAPANVVSVLEGFAPARPTAAILTKLDEAPSIAGVLSRLVGGSGPGRTPLSYLTNGQQVPDDIELASTDMLVSRLLPTEFPHPQLDAA